VPQLQSSPSVELDELGSFDYIYPVVEVVFQGLSLEEKSWFAVAIYLYRVNYIPSYIPSPYLLKRDSGLYFVLQLEASGVKDVLLDPG
jgi:hypothetical protein